MGVLTNPARVLTPVNVVIVDSRIFDRSALSLLCGEDPSLRVIAMVEDAQRARNALARSQGNVVVLVGQGLLRGAGAPIVAALRCSTHNLRVVMVGIGEPNDLKLEAIRLGADGVLQRDGEAATQLAAIRGEAGAVPRWS